MALLVLSATSDWAFLIGILAPMVFLLQFFMVGIPSLGHVLFAERVPLGERLIGLTMIVAGLGATALSARWAWHIWGIRC